MPSSVLGNAASNQAWMSPATGYDPALFGGGPNVAQAQMQQTFLARFLLIFGSLVIILCLTMLYYCKKKRMH
ncbi:hypothetical protein PsorP6_013485 [Peronosclerospora sorghi]|uniref:Uncharacterized protein n=1 Tax=Peronosclerospora sorghi TaxID=230839 RepID=A0ACC0VJK7_9STRA|nr:hypothetical protein PsorP6_013485 [Peronosclerospora sorghi]